jgi:hypothetical protein
LLSYLICAATPRVRWSRWARASVCKREAAAAAAAAAG